MTRGLKLAVMLGFVGACLLLSTLGLIALGAGGRASLGPITLLEVAAGYDRRADLDLASPRPSASELRDAAWRSRAAIAQFPYDTAAWARLAYIDYLENGELSPAGVAALQRSYEMVGVDPDLGIWRVGFALDHSQALPPALRASVKREVGALWTRPEDRKQLLKLQNALQNSGGKLSLDLWITELGGGKYTGE